VWGLTGCAISPFGKNARLGRYAAQGVQLLKPRLPDALAAYVKA